MTLSLVLNVHGADGDDGHVTIVVRQGDTLWDHAKRYGKRRDVRQYIRMIKEANQLEDSMIYAGDVLKLP